MPNPFYPAAGMYQEQSSCIPDPRRCCCCLLLESAPGGSTLPLPNSRSTSLSTITVSTPFCIYFMPACRVVIVLLVNGVLLLALPTGLALVNLSHISLHRGSLVMVIYPTIYRSVILWLFTLLFIFIVIERFYSLFYIIKLASNSISSIVYNSSL